MNGQKKIHIDPKGPKLKNRAKQFQIYHLPTDYVENINSTNKGRDLLLVKKPRIVPWGEERMPQRIQRHSRVTLHRSTHPKWEQDQTEKSCTCWIDYKKEYDMFPQSWIINCFKMYKISHEVINFIEKKHEYLDSGIDSRWRKLSWRNDPKRYFKEDALLLLQYITAMMPLNHVLREAQPDTHLVDCRKKIHHLFIKLFEKKKKNWRL